MNSYQRLILVVGYSLSASSLWAQVSINRVDQQVSIQEVIRQQRENEARHATQIAPVVERQLQINHPDDPAVAKQMFDSWKNAHLVQNQAAAGAAEANAARNSTNDPLERQSRNEELKTQLGKLRHIQTEIGEVIDHVEDILRRDGGIAGTPVPGNRSGQLVLPKDGEVSLYMPELTREELNRMSENRALQQAEAIRKAAEAANASPLEAGTAPGTAPGTQAERLVQALQNRYDGGDLPRVDVPADDLGQSLPNPAEIQTLMGQLSSCHSRIYEHNARMPNIPKSLSESEFNYWKPIADAYDAEARSLESEQSDILGRLDAVSR